MSRREKKITKGEFDLFSSSNNFPLIGSWASKEYNTINPKISSYEDIDPSIRDVVSKNHKIYSVSSDPVSVFEINDCIVMPNGVFFINENVVAQSVHDFPLKNKESLQKPQSFDRISSEKPVLILSKYGYRNYGHWLIEIMPKIKFIVESGINLRDVSILVGHTNTKLDKVVRDSLRMILGFEPDLVAIDRPVSIKRAIYCTPITKHPFKMRPEISELFFELKSANLSKSKPEKMLFVTRRSANNRFLEGAKLVESYLVSKGFEVVDPGELVFSEQIKLFSASNVVVGIAGAAMTNTVFMEEKAKILHLVPSSMPNLFFYQLASICKNNYYEFRGEASSKKVSMFSKSFEINFSKFEDFFENIFLPGD
ncbi:glycosyltransferase family 61 protein [Halomonas sp. CH40]